jgi:BirA family biotin operon repressor/biotin-[acetyl-CoA-carboxylase] ligase
MTESDLLPANILSRLKTSFVGQDVLYLPSVPSTMDAAKDVARRGCREGVIVIADEQTAGKGRLGRSWVTPTGSSIAVSVVLRPELSQLSALTMIASLAVTRGIEQVTGLHPTIKWPNDVLINGKKICGILIDSELRGDKVDWAVMGIGINVNLEPSRFPEIATVATSLSAELGREVSRLDVLCSFLTELEQLYIASRKGRPFYHEWRRRLETLGKQVRVTSGGIAEEGTAESVDRDGNLLLRRRDGSLTTIVAGDVTLR